METKTIEKLLEKEHITGDELKRILKQIRKGEHKTHTSIPLDYSSSHVKLGVISDLHIGHKCYRPDVLEHAIKNFNRSNVDIVLIPGDICEGMSGREGHIYELDKIGATNQINYAVEELSKVKQPMYAITATNSHDGWFSSKSDMGLEVGPELERRVENFNFAGYDEADIDLESGLKIRMVHPGGGTAYAISYKLQKYINGLSGGQKPGLLFEGHFHKSMYLFYRNIHAYESGTLEEQTIFMKKMQTPAMLGYWIVDAWSNKQGVIKVRNDFIPFYE